MIHPIQPNILQSDLKYLSLALATGNINDGPVVRMLEQAIGDYHGCECVCVSSGTSALEIILRYVGWGSYTIPYCSHISTAAAAITAGARALECAKEPFISADLNGRHSHCGQISDACQSQFTRGLLKGRHAVALSWGALKSITGGTGGAILSNDSKITAFAQSYKSYGRKPGGSDFDIERIGSNHKMSDINAGLALGMWERRDDIIADRWRVDNAYRALLGDRIWPRHSTEVPWLIECTVSPEFAASGTYLAYYPQYGHYPALRDHIVNWHQAQAPTTAVRLPSDFNIPQEDIEKAAAVILEAHR